MCASALPGKTGKHENRIFFTQMLYQCIARIQPVDHWFLQSFWLTTHTRAAVWLPKSCNQHVQLGAVGAWFRRKESAAAVRLCCTHNACAPVRCLAERKKMSSLMCLIALDICWDIKISHEYRLLTFTPGSTKNYSHLLHGDQHRDRLGKHRACG